MSKFVATNMFYLLVDVRVKVKTHVRLIVEEDEIRQGKVAQFLVLRVSFVFKLATQLQQRSRRLNIGDNNLDHPSISISEYFFFLKKGSACTYFLP
jgi:hypothetical protein